MTERPRNYRGVDGALWGEPFKPATEAGDNIWFSGDSHTEYDVWCAAFRARLRGTIAVHNVAVSGTTLESIIAADVSRVDPNYSADATFNACMCWCGTNDLSISAGSGLTGAAVLEFYRTYCNARTAAGFITLVGTMLPRGNASDPAAYESERLAFNTLLRSDHAFAAGLIDIAADARLGATGANDNATYFQDEGGAKVHLTAAGYEIVAIMAAQAYMTAKTAALVNG